MDSVLDGYGFTYAYAPSVLALAISFSVLNIQVVGLRFLFRRRQKVGFWVDDWLSVAGLICTLGCAVICIAGVALHAVGYPTPDVNLNDPTEYTRSNRAIAITSQCEWAMDIVSVLALGFIKLSFLFYLRRLFCPAATVRSVFNVLTWFMISLVSIWIVTFFIAWLAICGNDPAAFWGSFDVLLQKCGGAYHLLLAMTISDVIIDGVIVLMPILKTWSLHLPARKKVAVSSVFMVGLVVLAASIARLVLAERSSSTSASVDEDLYITNYISWTMFEVGMAMLGSCLISLRPLIPEIAGRRILEESEATLPEDCLGHNHEGTSENNGLARKSMRFGSQSHSSAPVDAGVELDERVPAGAA